MFVARLTTGMKTVSGGNMKELRFIAAERPHQGFQELRVVLPAIDRRSVQRPPDLVVAGRIEGARVSVERQAGRVAFQSAEVGQPVDFSAAAGAQFLVTHLHDFDVQRRDPVVQQRAVEPVERAESGKAAGVVMIGIEAVKVYRQAGIAR